MERFKLILPGSSANFGPGFDVFSAALTYYLNVNVEVDRSQFSARIDDIEIELETNSQDEGSLALRSPRKNLISLTIGLLAGLNQKEIPKLRIKYKSDMSSAVGLGSSGAATVAGACIANKVLDLGLTSEDLLTYCTLIEGSPDNVSSSIYGGFTVTYNIVDITEHMKSVEAYLTSLSATGDYRLNLPENVPHNMMIAVDCPFLIDVRFITLVPRELLLNTREVRKILPDIYSREDLVKTIRNTSMLLSCIGGKVKKERLPECLSACLKDVVHQNYRIKLIPGGQRILDLKPGEIEGLIGAYLSGSGPSFQVLATHNFDEIGSKLVELWHNAALQEGREITCYYKVNDLCEFGARLVTDS